MIKRYLYGRGWTSDFYPPSANYCRHCGAKLEDKIYAKSYDEKTGEEIYWIKRVCSQNCQTKECIKMIFKMNIVGVVVLLIILLLRVLF